MKRILHITFYSIIVMALAACASNSSIDGDGFYYFEPSEIEDNVFHLSFPISGNTSDERAVELFRSRAVNVCGSDDVVITELRIGTTGGMVKTIITSFDFLKTTDFRHKTGGSFYCNAPASQIEWHLNRGARIDAEIERLGVEGLSVNQLCEMVLRDRQEFLKDSWYKQVEEQCAKFARLTDKSSSEEQ